MRPEDLVVTQRNATSAIPMDVALEALDAELKAAGTQARRMLNGQRQPTRYFTLELRRTLLEAFEGEHAR